MDMGRQLNSNPTAGTSFVGLSPSQPLAALRFSPPFKVTPMIANAYLPGIINLNLQLSQKVDLGFIDNRVLRRALSTTIFGGGVTLSALYTSGFFSQDSLNTLDTHSQPQPEFTPPEAFKWQENPADPVPPPTESASNRDTPLPNNLLMDLERSERASEGLLPQASDVVNQGQQAELLDDTNNLNASGDTPPNDFRSSDNADQAFGEKSFFDWVNVFSKGETYKSAFGVIACFTSFKSSVKEWFLVLSRQARNVSSAPENGSPWDTLFTLASLVSFYVSLRSFLQQREVDATISKLPRAIPGEPVLPSSCISDESLGTACTDPSLRVYLSRRGVPFRLPLLSQNGSLLATLNEVAFRDSRLDPYGMIVRGGSGSAGAKAALLGSSGIDYTELCFRSSAVNPDWKKIQPTPGDVPKLTSLVTVCVPRPVLTSTGISIALKTTAVKTCGWIGDTLIGTAIGLVAMALIVIGLVLSLPLLLLGIFFLSTTGWREIKKGSNELKSRQPQITAKKASAKQRGKRRSWTGIQKADSVAFLHYETLLPAPSTAVTEATSSSLSTSAIEFQPSIISLVGDLIVPVEPNSLVTVIPATPNPCEEQCADDDMVDAILSAEPAQFSYEGEVDDFVGNSIADDPEEDEKAPVIDKCLPATDEPAMEPIQVDTPEPPVHLQLVEESLSYNGDTTLVASAYPESSGGIASMITTDVGCAIESIKIKPFAPPSEAEELVCLAAGHDNVFALSTVAETKGSKDKTDRQKLVDDVVEAHIRSVEARANRTLASSMWSEVPSGSFQSNAQLLDQTSLACIATQTVIPIDHHMSTNFTIEDAQRSNQGIQPDDQGIRPTVKLPVSLSHSEATLTRPTTSTSRTTMGVDRNNLQEAGDGSANGERSGLRSGAGKRWGAPAQGLKPKNASKTRWDLPVPDWANA